MYSIVSQLFRNVLLINSLACWIVLLMPQLIEQWRMKSAKGIALGFISIWFMGDLLNLVGAVWAGLLSEVIFLAVWFCIADSMMIFSYFYYTYIYPRQHQSMKRSRNNSGPISLEDAPLLRRHSSTLTNIALAPQLFSIFNQYVLPILFVISSGCLGYFLSESNSENRHDDIPSSISVGPQILGYLSAFLYLGARIPQILQNHKRRSVEGLSLLFFLFSTLGNLTYAGQILFYRSDPDYILLNLSWLLGSLGTIFEDCVIFLQFYTYGNHHDIVNE